MKNKVQQQVKVSYQTEEYDIYINSYTPKEIAVYKRMIGCNRPFISTTNSLHGLIVKDSKTQVGKSVQNWPLVFGVFGISKTNPTRLAIEKTLGAVGKQPQQQTPKQPTVRTELDTEAIVDKVANKVIGHFDVILNGSKNGK